MTKYVVSGYIGFDNFGDEAIAMVLTDILKAKGAEKITLLSSNPRKTSALYDVESCSMYNFLTAIKNSDVLISGGGSLLQDVTSLKSLLYYLCVICSALLLGKKVEIFAQGIGPIKSSIGKFITKLILSKVSKITVRDKESKQLLEDWGINSELVKDPMFSLTLPTKNNKGIVGIQLRKWDGVDDIFMEKLTNEIKKNFSDKKIEIISLQDNLDKGVCRKLSEKMKKEGMQSEILSDLSVKDAFEVISNLEYLICMRFHAGVAGLKSGVKVLLINYDPKVKNLADEYNLPIIEFGQYDFSNEFKTLLNK